MFLARHKKSFVLMLVLALVVCAGSAFANTTSTNFATPDTSFDAVVQFLGALSVGSLGKAIALALFIMGMVWSIASRNLLPVAGAIGAGLALLYIPDIIMNLFTAIV